MDLNEINAPQYVNFDSDSFHRDMEGLSPLTEDSMDDSKHNENDDSLEQYLSSSQFSVEKKNIRNKYYDTVRSEDGESIMNDTDYDTVRSEDGGSTMNDTNESLNSTLTSEGSEFMEAKENFPVQKNKMVFTKVKPAQNRRTVPEPFQFATSNRLKNKTNTSINYKEQDFKSQLRQNSVLQSKKNRITKVEPFQFTENKKRKRVENDYKSLAEQVSAFQNKTPQRYHTSHKGFEPQEHWEPPHLAAKSPNLQALKRRRVVTALSKEQQEEKEIEEMKAHEFHARPVDPKIYNHHTFTDNRKVKAMIKTKNFYLKTAQRALQHKRKTSEKQYKFRARPVPSSILKGPTGLKEKPVIPTTAPKAPKFESENRIEKRKQMQLHKEEVKTLPEKKLPKHSFLSEPPPVVPWTKRRTEVCPFSFDTTDKKRFLEKEKRIQEEIENEKKGRVFHAQLMPYPSQPALPSVPRKPPTKVEPFNFKLSERNPKQFSFTSEQNVIFKAQPANVLKKEPFIPEKPAKQPIEIQEFNLHTNRRASERQQLRELKEAEEQEREQMRLMQKAEEERMMQEQLMKLRKDLVHKANPVRQYKPVDVKPSSLPLTTPQSPNFETEKRIQARY